MIELPIAQSAPDRSARNGSGGNRGGIIALAVLALILIVAFVSGGTSNFGGSTNGTNADAATTAAIQQVIQSGNDAQVQAIATGDPSPMQATATSDYYNQAAQANADMLKNGVTAISVVNIEWGPVTVNGNSASATTWETWTTNYNDGTTEESRDQNVYTLALSGSTWKIQADDHPDTSTGPGLLRRPVQTPTSVPSGAVTPAASESPSRNWAGYAASGTGFTGVSARWTIPPFSPGAAAGTDATWVGVGGFDTKDLIQAGTEQTTSGDGATDYDAWVEMLPNASDTVLLPVHAGDTVSVSIVQQSTGTWLISLVNDTTGQRLDVTEQYTSSLSSAEWIEEAPSSGHGRVLALDNFGTVTFSNAVAVKNGRNLTAAEAGATALSMAGRGGQIMAHVSELSADGTTFSVSSTGVQNAVAPSRGLVPSK